MLVNNQEIQAISSENNISCYDFHLYFNNEAVQLFESDYTFTWNQFFQFMIIILFAPQIVIFYVLLVINSNYNGSVSINDIIMVLRNINEVSINRGDIRKLFDYFDLNKDGYLTLNQFCNFISKSINYFENIITLRENIIDTIYPHSHIFSILKRKLYIEKIRRYKLENNNELPPLNCYNKIRMLIFSTPHPYEYNYDYNEISDNMINLHSLLSLFMRNFIPNYSFQKEVQSLPLKYLKIFKEFIVVSKIDNYYIKFKEQSSVNTITSMSILSPFSVTRKVSSFNRLNSKCINDNDSTPIIIAQSSNTPNTVNTNSTPNTGNTGNTGNTTSNNRDGKGSLLSGSMSINQTRHCSILRKPSFATKIKHRSDVIPNYSSTYLNSNNNNNSNSAAATTPSMVKPTIDTSINKSKNNNNNNNNKIKRNSTDSSSPFNLNVESRDESPIYSFTPPTLQLPLPSSASTNTTNLNINNNNCCSKPNLRPTSTSLNLIQIKHSTSCNCTTLPPTYPTNTAPLRPTANSCDDAGFNHNQSHTNRLNYKISNNNNNNHLIQRSNSNSSSVTIPGFISPSDNEENDENNNNNDNGENYDVYNDDDDLDMKV